MATKFIQLDGGYPHMMPKRKRDVLVAAIMATAKSDAECFAIFGKEAGRK